MAVRNIDEARKSKSKKEPRKLSRTHIVMIAAIVFLFGTAIGLCAVNYAQAAEYNSQISRVSEEASLVSQESAEIKETLKEENHDEYFEKVAREQYGYCKPGEKVYYDSAYGE